MTRNLVSLAFLMLLASSALLSNPAMAENWPQWRGPEANGISREKGLPVTWDSSDSIIWKVKLPGRGNSTPIIWGDRLFLTFQIGSGKVEVRSARHDGPVQTDDGPVTFVVQCLRSKDGTLLWEHRIPAEKPLPPVHAFHNLSSPSPITDGERVYAWFGTGQIVVLTMDGKRVWSRSLGKEYSPYQLLWGHGSSPVIHNEHLFLLCDHNPAAYLLALDRRTGREVWKVDRGQGLRSYSTPFLMKVGERHELIVNSNPRVDAYDPQTGRLLWHADDYCRVPVPTPTSAEGILYMSRGYNSGPYMAIRPGGTGNVNESHVLWRVPTGAPYVSSLVHYEDLLYMATEVGIVRCIEARTGKTVWTERVGGNFSASPVVAEGRIYLLNEAGETVVLEAGRKCRILARNALGEVCRASPAVAGGRILIRSDQHLYSIGTQQTTRLSIKMPTP
ncbi:MAG: PQQ-binding-like beta-propeller repeat protein [Acidobacteriota bacterium]